MLDIKGYETLYHRLEVLSKEGANLYMSEDVHNAIQIESGDMYSNYSERDALLRLQLASDFFEEMVIKNKEALLSQDKSKPFATCIDYFLSSQLKNISASERQAVLTDMIGKAFDLADETLSDDDFYQLKHLDENNLKNRLIDIVESLAIKMVQNCSKELETQTETDILHNSSFETDTFSKDASACAKFVYTKKLHNLPEMLGFSSGAVATLKTISTDQDIEEMINNISFIMILLAGMLLMLFLLMISYGTLYGVLLELAHGAIISLPLITEVLAEVLGWVAIELKITLGVGALGLLTKAIMLIREKRLITKLINFLRPKTKQVIENSDTIEDVDVNGALIQNHVEMKMQEEEDYELYYEENEEYDYEN